MRNLIIAAFLIGSAGVAVANGFDEPNQGDQVNMPGFWKDSSLMNGFDEPNQGDQSNMRP